MSTTNSHPDLHQDCLDKLSRALDLVLKSAEAASADNNHKAVIQAAREATRITALIFKMTNPKTKNALAPRPQAAVPAAQPAAAAPAGKPDTRSEDFVLTDLDKLFSPREIDSWDSVTKSMYATVNQNYHELQNLCDELAAGLPVTGSLPAQNRIGNPKVLRPVRPNSDPGVYQP